MPTSEPVDRPASSTTPSTHLLGEAGAAKMVGAHKQSPETVTVNSGNAQPSIARRLLQSVSTLAGTSSASAAGPNRSTAPNVAAPDSPCFVHCWLDKAASRITRSTHPVPASEPAPTAAQSSHGHLLAVSSTTTAPSITLSYDDDKEEDDSSSSLTRKLVETAVSVREMSKQLGRSRIRSKIQSVLIVTKARDNRLIKLTRKLALYLMLRKCESSRGLVVYVDAQLRHSKRFDAAGMQRDHPELFRPDLSRRRTSSNMNLAAAVQSSRSTPCDAKGKVPAQYPSEESQLRYWTREMCTNSPHLFDFVVTLGGDGTVLFTSWLFQRIVPPVLPFALGSLGFLTNFDFSDYQAVMEGAIESGYRVNLRMRFMCTVYRAIVPRHGKGRKSKKGDASSMLLKALENGGWEAIESGVEGSGDSSAQDAGKGEESMRYRTRPEESFEVLNDLVIDRGLNPYISLLELFGDEHHMTTVQADGLCIATPTGSTAYSLAAGGSLVNPEIPAMLITPICPHTLSFRPILLPDTMELRICVPYNSRSSAWASFDGRGRIELKQGDHLKVTASKYPFPTVCSDKPSTDWFHAISRTLKWNDRERQKSFVVFEEDPAPTMKKSTSENETATEEDEEETFDIDYLAVQHATSSSTSISTSSTQVQSSRAQPEALPKAIGTHVYGKVVTDSPDRFHSRAPRPPRLSPRHLPLTDAGTGVMYGDSTRSPLHGCVGAFSVNGREETDCSASNCSTT